MVPAALPAFSAPTGVSVVPSLATSAAESSAAAGAAKAAPNASATIDFLVMNDMDAPPRFIVPLPNPLPRERERTWEAVSRLLSERIADHQGIKVAVFDGVGARGEARRLARRDHRGSHGNVGAA